MSDVTNHPIDTTDPEYLSRLREDAAGIVRDLMAAVNQTKSRDLITDEDRRQWWNSNNTPSNERPENLLLNAASNLRKFGDSYGGQRTSMAYVEEGESLSPDDVPEQLHQSLLFFAYPKQLRKAARSIRKQQSVDWAELCDWPAIPNIRKLLDQLPGTTRRKTRTEFGTINLVTVPPHSLRYGKKSIHNLRSGIWKFLDDLLQKESHFANFDDLFGTDAVWDDDNGDVDLWIRVYSRIRDTNKILRDNEIPLMVSSDRKRRIVFLKERELSPGKKTPAIRGRTTASRGVAVKTDPPGKKTAAKVKAPSKRKP